MPDAVILAAGASQRLGSPKALTDLGGQSALSRLCGTLERAGCARIVVVVGASCKAVAASAPAGCEVVENPDWRQGQTSSAQAGLTVLQRSDRVVIAPVDRPLVRASTISAVADAGQPIAVPVHDGRRGHPLAVSKPVVSEIMDLDVAEPLHAVVRRDPTRVAGIVVDDPAVHWNLDTPEDVARALGALDHA